MRDIRRRLLAVAFLIGAGSQPPEPRSGPSGSTVIRAGKGGTTARTGFARTVRQDFGFARHAARGGPSGGRTWRPDHTGSRAGILCQADLASQLPRPADRLRHARLRCGAGPRPGRLLQRGDRERVADAEHDRDQDPGPGGPVLRLRRVRHIRWRAGGDDPRPFARVRDPQTGRLEPRGFAAQGAVHRWSLAYDPRAAGGRGAITATIDGETSVCELAPGHKADGATFDRFGVLTVSKSADSPGELWLDDIEIGGRSRPSPPTPAGKAGGTGARTRRPTSARVSISGSAPPGSPAGPRRASWAG